MPALPSHLQPSQHLGVKGSDEIGDIEMEEIEEEGGIDVDVKMMDVEGDVEMDDA